MRSAREVARPRRGNAASSTPHRHNSRTGTVKVRLAMATFVLLHGAYQGGWIWQRVAARLAAGGHSVFAPSLDGCAERRHALRSGITTETQAAEIAELLFFHDLSDVVLVGTSTGGMVACKTAELARDRIGRLVFADAL